MLHMAPPGPSVFHSIVDVQLQLVLAPKAKGAGLVGGTAFNLGSGPTDFRVPDGAFFRGHPRGAFVPTAEVVVEILSPDDETFEKVGFYSSCGVKELLVAHPEERWVRCYDLQNGCVEVPVSQVLAVAMSDVEAAIDWPE